MKHQPNRLPADAKQDFGGGAIDRGKPLTFRLNGRRYEAFAGDTVLTALLAAGVDTAGTYHGEPITIDERFAPPVLMRGASDPTLAMPMDRVPVVPGLSLTTLGPHQSALSLSRFAPRLMSLVGRHGRTLGHKLDDPRAIEGAWITRAPERTIEADTIVVGGGIAGMAAALAAADAGGRVVLIERRGELGGDARFFGAVGDQESPEAAIARLGTKIAATPSITQLPFTEAFALAGRTVRAHQVAVDNDRPQPRVVAITAPRIVLATGAAERLPIFPGNRAPGVSGAVAAFNRANRHGVWLGRRTVFATPHNFAYRLALLAADAGIEVQRVADTRPAPQSRFVDFCKASGITLATGLAPRAAEPGSDAAALKVAFAVSIEGAAGDTAPMTTALLVASGAWQARLALWLVAGGGCAWNEERRHLDARGHLEGVALAGAAAGHRGLPACIRSGEHAVATLLGNDAPPIEDLQPDAIYESHDAPTPIAAWRVGRGAAFLDGGITFTTRPTPRKEGGTSAGELHGLSVGDVAASVEVGLVPAADAGIIAAERCLGGGEIADSGWRVTVASADNTPPTVPPYLTGRFGPKPQLAIVAADDGRNFDAGCLLYPSSDLSDPMRAVGAAIGRAPGGNGSVVVASRNAIAEGAALFLRDTSGPVPVRLVEKLKG